MYPQVDMFFHICTYLLVELMGKVAAPRLPTCRITYALVVCATKVGRVEGFLSGGCWKSATDVGDLSDSP